MKHLLAIETSCDETAVAAFDLAPESPALLGELVSSQTELHKLYGGVVPELASREHLRHLPLLTGKLLAQLELGIESIDAIAVTRGPGLKGALLMGIGFAKGLALARGIPILGVNHIEAHVLSAKLDNPELRFPYLSLVVSGGHTEIHLVTGVGEYRLLARTSDDAAGEAFDKSANLLGFDYPGGPKLAALADTVTSSRFKLPRVMRESEGFSFSGLKTAISLLIRDQGEGADPVVRAELAHAIQRAIVDALVFKVEQSVRETGVKSVALCGGVAANKTLRAALSGMPGVALFCPSQLHCMDNAGMIGYLGALRMRRGERSGFEIEALARWPIEAV